MRIVHNSLHEDVAERLRTLIFEGDLPPGAFLDEVQLSAQMEISRTPLREALKVLTAEGLVRHEPRRGCFVGEVTEKDLDEIFPVIALLEGRCAFEAAQNASDADLATLEALHDKLSRHARTRRINEYYATNFVIHEAIIRLANNKWLEQVITDLRKSSSSRACSSCMHRGGWSKACRSILRSLPRSRRAMLLGPKPR